MWPSKRVWLTEKRYASATISIKGTNCFLIDNDLYEVEYEWGELKEYLLKTYPGRPVSVSDFNQDVEYIFDTAEDAVYWVEKQYFRA